MYWLNMRARETTKLKTFRPLARTPYGRISTVYETMSGRNARLAILLSVLSHPRVSNGLLVGGRIQENARDNCVSGRGILGDGVACGAHSLQGEEQQHAACRRKKEEAAA